MGRTDFKQKINRTTFIEQRGQYLFHASLQSSEKRSELDRGRKWGDDTKLSMKRSKIDIRSEKFLRFYELSWDNAESGVMRYEYVSERVCIDQWMY